MTLDELYNDIFPLGFVDDNNKYIDRKSNELNTIQLLEPTVGVTEFVIPPKDRTIENNIPDRMAFRIPLVAINNTTIKQELITGFYLDYSSFVPSVMVEFVDLNNEMLSTNSIRDGSIIKVYIGGHGDELYYKPIRQDFMVTNIIRLNSGEQNDGEWIQYRLNGILNVPMGHRKESWSNSPVTSMQELFNLCIYTGLGFATNFTHKTIDRMKWINPSGVSFFDFMKDIADHACYSPNTFFTAFVDQYYVLNFVECHSLLSHGGRKTDTPAMIYPDTQEPEQPKVDKSQNDGKNRKTSDQIHVYENSGDNDMINDSQTISCYFISNHTDFYKMSNYIESYNEISDGYSSVNDGYRKHIVYADSNTSGWGTNVEFTITPIDNLQRDPKSQKIQSLPKNVGKDTYIPLNLMQMNNFEYQDANIKEVDRLSGVESFVNLGEVDTSNMFKQYYFAQFQNEYQMTCMKKCGLRVTLQNYNPSITKYSRIWVDLFDTNLTSTQNFKKDTSVSDRESSSDSFATQYQRVLNEEIIQYDDDCIMNPGTGEEKAPRGGHTNFPRGNYNRSLSGWYVVTEMKIEYDNYEKNLKMHLMLNRIEHKPLFRSEYELARKAVDKYKEENRPECICNIIDDYSYTDE